MSVYTQTTVLSVPTLTYNYSPSTTNVILDRSRFQQLSSCPQHI